MATRRKRSAFATDVPPNFNTAWLLLPRDLGRKARTVQVRAFFCVSCTRQLRTVTRGNGDGGNGGGAGCGSWMLCTCHFICLRLVFLYWLKVSARLSQ